MVAFNPYDPSLIDDPYPAYAALRDEAARAAARGDVLVLATGVDAIGVIVDQVIAVHDEADLVSLGEERPSGLPHYVVEVLRRRGAPAPVLLVDLRQLLAVVA